MQDDPSHLKMEKRKITASTDALEADGTKLVKGILMD